MQTQTTKATGRVLQDLRNSVAATAPAPKATPTKMPPKSNGKPAVRLAGDSIGRNVTAEVSGGVLTLRIALDVTGVASKSGKSAVVATTNGNVPIAGIDGAFRLGINFYRLG